MICGRSGADIPNTQTLRRSLPHTRTDRPTVRTRRGGPGRRHKRAVLQGTPIQDDSASAPLQRAVVPGVSPAPQRTAAIQWDAAGHPMGCNHPMCCGRRSLGLQPPPRLRQPPPRAARTVWPVATCDHPVNCGHPTHCGHPCDHPMSCGHRMGCTHCVICVPSMSCGHSMGRGHPWGAVTI